MPNANAEASLAGCVASLGGCSRSLGASITQLDSGTRDLPRIQKVLQITRHFELVSEPKLFQRQKILADEIAPAIEQLLSVVERELANMERREKGLAAQIELQEGRLNQNAKRSATTSSVASEPGTSATDFVRAEKYRMLKNKKERLEATSERLSLQIAQKERILRMSTNYGQ